jgi:WW domain-containing adapter protein with coiled-coil
LQNSKYNNSNRYSNYYRDREASPPKRIAHRSVSPEGSPRDGRDRYHQSSSYRNKDREREYKKDKYSGNDVHHQPATRFDRGILAEKRGRDRDIEYKNYNSKKAKTRDRSSSEDEHKEERLYDKRYSDRDSVRRPLEKERRFGDWKEMISKGSGKKYYYNERDKSSQWEKPEEWTEYDM